MASLINCFQRLLITVSSPLYVYYHYEVLSNKPKTYEELSDIDTERRLLNKRTKLGFFAMIFQVSGTLCMSLLFDITFWCTMIVYFVTRFKGSRTLNELPGLGSTGLSIGASLVTFALVFYVTQSYSRYCQQYDAAMAVEGRIFDICLLIHASSMSSEGTWRLFRYINAAHGLGYAGLGSAYSSDNFFLPLNTEFRLLTNVELNRLSSIGFSGGTCYREVLIWAMESMRNEYMRGYITDYQLQQFNGQLLLLRSRMATLYDFADQPVPFSYVHFINYLLFVFLPIFAYTIAHSYPPPDSVSTYSIDMIRDSIVEGCSVFLFTAAAICLRTIATRLQDPFGNSLEDLSVVHYVKFMIKASSKMLCHQSCPLTNLEEERKLFYERPDFGQQFAFGGSSAVENPRIRGNSINNNSTHGSDDNHKAMSRSPASYHHNFDSGITNSNKGHDMTTEMAQLHASFRTERNDNDVLDSSLGSETEHLVAIHNAV